MKYLFVLSLFSLPSITSAAEWKVIAETTSCRERIQVLGKEGEKYVLAVKGDEKMRLFSKDGSLFLENSPQTTEFVFQNADVTYRFIRPSYVEANSPKMDVISHGQQKRCKMNLR
jgi:hypothetical protein